MMARFDYTDDSVVLVIGSGAAGATVAHELCAHGIRVVMLEAGPKIEMGDFHQDELRAYEQLSWADKRIATGDWLAAKLAPDRPSWTVKAVGGSTIHWNGLAYRMQEHEFMARSVYGDIEGASLINWPVTLEDIEPYYALAEDRMGVTGTHGIARHPPNNNYKVLYNGARRVGYSQISNANIAINSDFRDGRSPCIQMGFCNQGCKVGAKWSTLYGEVPKAEATGKLDLRTGCMALQIEHDRTGKATGVLYADKGGTHKFQAARVVCIAGNAIETPRLLLNSASSLFPDGLANSSGHVGKHYTRHTGAISLGVFDQPVNMHRGITTPGTVFDEAGHDEQRAFAGGYLMEAVSLGLPSVAMLMQPGGWGADYVAFLEQYAHMAGVLLVGEEMPRPGNGVTLDDEQKDQYGLPVPRVHVDEHPMCNELRTHYHGRVEAIFGAVGAKEVRHSIPASAAHNMGTCRMSRNPDAGVTNAWGQCHEVKNLYVSDGSLFPTSSTENPTLTIVALAIRQAEHIAKRVSSSLL